GAEHADVPVLLGEVLGEAFDGGLLFLVAAFEGDAFDAAVEGFAGGDEHLLVVDGGDVGADLGFDAAVAHEAVAGLAVLAGEVHGVGVAVGVAAGDVEEEDDVVAQVGVEVLGVDVREERDGSGGLVGGGFGGHAA